MIKKPMAYSLVALIVCAASVSYSQTTYTWTGGSSTDWGDTGNWAGGLVPATNSVGYLGSGDSLANQVTIRILGAGTYQPDAATVPAFADQTGSAGATDGRTPHFQVESGASLSVNAGVMSTSGGAGILKAGQKATVNGGSLTLNSTTSMTLGREGVTTWSVNSGGELVLAPTELYFGHDGDTATYSTLSLDNGTLTINASNGRMRGSRNGTTTIGGNASTITLGNGSMVDASGSVFWSNILDASDNATVVFDLTDANSTVKFKQGGAINTDAKLDAVIGKVFTTSTLDVNDIDYTLTGGVYTITIPEPSTLGLIGLIGAGLVSVRRFFII